MAGVVQVWAVVLILLWYIFYEARLFLTSLQAYQNQAQGVCLDGRSMEDQNSARFNVTTEALTWNQRLGPATETPELVCDFPVSVHLCPSDASIEECQTNAVNLPIYQRSRTEKTGVRCWGVLGFYMWGAHPCKDEIWHCTDGLCNGYRKSQRLCASNLRREFYPCFFVPSSDEYRVQEERYAYPLDTGSLVICLFLALAFILSYFRGTFLLTLINEAGLWLHKRCGIALRHCDIGHHDSFASTSHLLTSHPRRNQLQHLGFTTSGRSSLISLQRSAWCTWEGSSSRIQWLLQSAKCVARLDLGITGLSCCHAAYSGSPLPCCEAISKTKAAAARRPRRLSSHGGIDPIDPRSLRLDRKEKSRHAGTHGEGKPEHIHQASWKNSCFARLHFSYQLGFTRHKAWRWWSCFGIVWC